MVVNQILITVIDMMSRWEGSILRNTFSSSNDVRLYWDEVCFKFITRTCGCITNTFHTNSNVAGHFSSVPRSHSLCLCCFPRVIFSYKTVNEWIHVFRYVQKVQCLSFQGWWAWEIKLKIGLQTTERNFEAIAPCPTETILHEKWHCKESENCFVFNNCLVSFGWSI